jgi:uncharacterized protein (TIGR03435 family)
MHRWILLTCFSLAANAAPQDLPAFEVASVKPSSPQSIRMFDGGPGSHDPGMISWSRATLNDLLYYAYGLQDSEQISGPEWLANEPYDIAAKIPTATTKAQFQTMLQGLLAERFKVELHHQTRDFPVYYLVIAKNVPKLKEPNSDTDREGFPHIPAGRPGISMNFSGGRARLTARQRLLSDLAQILRVPAGRQVLDQTGLTGEYDFTLEFSLREMTGQPSTDADSVPSLFDALPQQLGLKLEDRKAPFDVLVIDHAERVPTGN